MTPRFSRSQQWITGRQEQVWPPQCAAKRNQKSGPASPKWGSQPAWRRAGELGPFPGPTAVRVLRRPRAGRPRGYRCNAQHRAARPRSRRYPGPGIRGRRSGHFAARAEPERSPSTPRPSRQRRAHLHRLPRRPRHRGLRWPAAAPPQTSPVLLWPVASAGRRNGSAALPAGSPPPEPATSLTDHGSFRCLRGRGGRRGRLWRFGRLRRARRGGAGRSESHAPGRGQAPDPGAPPRPPALETWAVPGPSQSVHLFKA
jgi:hypothetical protein